SKRRMHELVNVVGDRQENIEGDPHALPVEIIRARRELRQLREAHPELVELVILAADDLEAATVARTNAQRLVFDAKLDELRPAMLDQMRDLQDTIGKYLEVMEAGAACGALPREIFLSGPGPVAAKISVFFEFLEQEKTKVA